MKITQKTDTLPVFVYGTLRTGQGNHRVIAPLVSAIHRAELPQHRLYSSGLPYVGPGQTEVEVVIGELVTLRQDLYTIAMERLDQLEGVDHGFYLREALPVRFYCGKTAPTWRTTRAWVYLGGEGFPYEPDLIVPGGDWVTGRALRRRQLVRA